MDDIELYTGDSSRPIYIRPDIADDQAVISNDWSCHTWVTDKYGAEIITSREEVLKTNDDMNFVISLSSDDRSLLDVKGDVEEYEWVIQLTNNMLIPTYEREKRITVIARR